MAVSTRLLWPVGCVLLLLMGRPAAGQDAPPDTSLQSKQPIPAVEEKNLCCLPTDTPVRDRVTTITLDFACRCFEKATLDTLNHLLPGQLYRLRIVHINPLLYKITMGVRDTAALAPLPFPTYGSLGISDLAGLAAGLTATAVAPPKVDKATQKKMNEIGLSFPNFSDKIEADKLLAKRSGEIQNQISSLASYTKELDSSLLKYNKLVSKSYLDYTATYVPSLPSAAEFEAAVEKFGELREKLATLRQAVDKSNAAYVIDFTPLRAAIATDSDLKKKSSLIDTTYQHFSATLTKVLAGTSAEGVQTLLVALTNAANNSSLQYVSLPQQFTKDQSRLRIDIVPRSSTYAVGEFHTQLVYPLSNKHFWGVSTGFFISQLTSEAYSTSAQTSAGGTPTYRLVAEDPGKFEYGLSAMVRYGYFLGSNPSSVGVQAGFGPALAVGTKVRPRLLLGAGLVAGRAHKLLVDGGLALGYVDRLSRAFDPTSAYATAPPDNPVVSTLKTSFYFGLHYLFTR